jgi:hypothetical protein
MEEIDNTSNHVPLYPIQGLALLPNPYWDASP